MPVSKILFQGVKATQKAYESEQEDFTLSDDYYVDKEKSHAAKYMLGATALAGAIAIGVIGHKNNWFQKLTQLGQKVAQKKQDVINNLALDSSIGHSVDNIGSSKLKNIETYEKHGAKYINKKANTGRVFETYVYENGKTLSEIINYDPQTGNLLKKTFYNSEGNKIDNVIEYDKVTGLTSRKIYYQLDGETVSREYLYDSKTGNKVKSLYYNSDGKSPRYVAEYDQKTGSLKKDAYYSDGCEFDYVNIYDPVSGKCLETTFYNADGSVKSVDKKLKFNFDSSLSEDF